MRRSFLKSAAELVAAVHLPAWAAGDHLDGVVPLARDDIAAIAQARTQGRHVLLYFGDHLN